MAHTHTRSIGVLIVSNLFGGIGVASGIAAGGLLAAELASTSWAGVAQASSTLGAGIAAVPLANLAATRGRRRSLSQGYFMAIGGALLIITAALLGQVLVLLVGMGLFGVAQAVNLQTRYAAAENVSLASRARGMSVVLWATTIGSVAGPNLLAPGNALGEGFDLPRYAGPFLFSVVAFAAAATVIAVLFRPSGPDAPAHRDSSSASGHVATDADPAIAPKPPLGAFAALKWSMGDPVARFAVILVAAAHAVMVMVMVMTPVHMEGRGDTLELVGFTISMHVLGMYGLSPVFGWAIDRFGAMKVAALGLGIEASALVLGFLAADGRTLLTVIALTLLGLGWSAAILAGSSLIAMIPEKYIRVPLQGASDAGMNYAAAGAAAVAGPILSWGAFYAVNAAAAIVLLPAILLFVVAARVMRATRTTSDTTSA